MTTSQTHVDDLPDCWNRIGVTGDQSCEKLVTHVHCRNCEVYAGAAQRNLQRPVGTGYKKEWADHFRLALSDGIASDTSALVFRVGREWLALPTKLFVAVAPQATPHRLPHRSDHGLIGIVNVGGKLHPCISLAALLGVDQRDLPRAKDHHTFARLLVIEWEEQSFALPVADIHGIIRYVSRSIQAPATTINKGLSHFLSGVITHQGMHIGCLDAALLGDQLARTLR